MKTCWCVPHALHRHDSHCCVVHAFLELGICQCDAKVFDHSRCVCVYTHVYMQFLEPGTYRWLVYPDVHFYNCWGTYSKQELQAALSAGPTAAGTLVRAFMDRMSGILRGVQQNVVFAMPKKDSSIAGDTGLVTTASSGSTMQASSSESLLGPGGDTQQQRNGSSQPHSRTHVRFTFTTMEATEFMLLSTTGSTYFHAGHE